MIEFTEKNGFINLKERLHICTFCGARLLFYELAPRKCTTCNKLLPDMQKLSISKQYRVLYHTGEESYET